MITYKIKRFGITLTPGAKEVTPIPEIVAPVPVSTPNLPAVSTPQALTGTITGPSA